MADPTETHRFTFGCYRAETVATTDDATTNGTDTETDDQTAITDGGTVSATTCPACEGDLANVQGVPACTHCGWNAH